MARTDVMDLVLVLVEGVVQRVGLHSRQTEHGVHTVIDE
jgi:hypothetical protein